MAIQKIALLNSREFEVKCSSSNIIAYIIAITETNLVDSKEQN